MTPPTVLLRVTPEAIETLFTRDHDGNRLRVAWGEVGADGFHDPVISVDYTDNIHAADKATIATLRAALDGLVVAAEVACECYEGFRSDGTLAPLLTGTQIAALRAALATAKETP